MSRPDRGADDADRLRRDDVRAQPVGKAEIGQHARRIGRKLDAGAGLLQPRGLFQHDGAKAGARQRERGGQPADPGAGDDDGAGTGHAPCSLNGFRRPPRTFQAHSAGRASSAWSFGL